MYFLKTERISVTIYKHKADIRRNRGELAEGWYDPEILKKAQASVADNDQLLPARPSDPMVISQGNMSDEEENRYGPALPSNSDIRAGFARHGKQAGPSIPTFQDLELQRGTST